MCEEYWDEKVIARPTNEGITFNEGLMGISADEWPPVVDNGFTGG